MGRCGLLSESTRIDPTLGATDAVPTLPDSRDTLPQPQWQSVFIGISKALDRGGKVPSLRQVGQQTSRYSIPPHLQDATSGKSSVTGGQTAAAVLEIETGIDVNLIAQPASPPEPTAPSPRTLGVYRWARHTSIFGAVAGSVYAAFLFPP